MTWACERHDRVTYLVSHTRRLGGGTITRLARNKWYAESDDHGDPDTFPTLTKAFWWVITQAEIADRANALTKSTDKS